MSLASRTAPLGLRAAAAWNGAPVSTFSALAWPVRLDTTRATSPTAARGQEQRAVRAATPGANGTLAWHALPGYGGWSAGPLPTDPTPDPWSPAWQQDFTVLLDAPDRSLVPARLRVGVPHANLVTWPWAPADERAAVRVYPSVTHPVPDGFVAVRARLWDPERDTAAAWAVLDVTANGHIASGVADESGDVVVFLPTPRLRAGLAPTAQSWPLTVGVRYARLVDLRTPSAPLLSSPAWAETAAGRLRGDMPSLDQIEGQAAGRLFATWTAPATNTPYAAPPLTPVGEPWLASSPQPPTVPLAQRETRLFTTP